MGNNLKDVMIALHPPSLDRCKEVVGAWIPPAGSDDHICGCTRHAFAYRGGFVGKSELYNGFLFEMTYSPPQGGRTSNYVVEADDWEK